VLSEFRLNFIAVCAVLSLEGVLCAGELKHPGEELYMQQCADCHGKQGEGVKEEYEEPLIGERSLPALTKRVKRTMPDDDPGSLTEEQAAQISAYMYEAFYSPAAQARLNPPEIELARLTVPQYRTAIADLVGHFRGGFQSAEGGEPGLKARYSGFAVERLGPKLPPPEGEKKRDEDKEKQRERERFERVDKQVVFSFGADSPSPGLMLPQEFQIRWDGSIYAPETGSYELVIRTENGARLWLNNPQKLLIDGWVSAGGDVREEKKSIFLLGGRHYPLSLEFFKFKDKSASISLLWKTPHGVVEPIPARYLSSRQVRPTMIVSTSFPADDRSVGYERGTGVSKAWYQAATASAVAVADHVEENLLELAGTKADAEDRIEKLKEFSRRFAATAFRRPLSDPQKAAIEAQFESAKTPEMAVKRVVLLSLNSPQFLYPGAAESEQPDDYDIAARLALTLWDSLPDEKLLKAAEEGKLRSRDELVAQANRMLGDGRAKAKVSGFFHHWLELERGETIAKDPTAFPQFDEAVLADLRTSLSMFLDAVVWSDRSDYRELIAADYLFLNGRLAKLYGKGDVGEEFQRVNVDRKERAGVITHPFLMTTMAHNKYTSPIHRGVFLTRNVLGLTLKSPPEAIAFQDGKFDPTFTMREKITELTKDRSCIGCHAVINPLGFALENYDAIGRWRERDNNKPVDPRGELYTDDAEVVQLAGARDVAEFAVRSEKGHRAFIRHLFRHVVKQDPAAFGPDAIDSLHRHFVANEFNIQKLMTEIAVIAASHGLSAPPTPQLAQQQTTPTSVP
jgi:hypothetical protein